MSAPNTTDGTAISQQSTDRSTDAASPAVVVHQVTKTYGDIVALEDLSMTVPGGSTFGLLGTNGAGKTTLFKLIVGHITPDHGSIDVGGRSVNDAGPAIRQEVGYLPEQTGFPPSLSGREVLAFQARARALDNRAERVADALDTVGLADAADRAVDGYSNGMRRRLGLAAALLPRPRILLLDEPTAGLDPRGVATFHRIIRDLREATGLTVVLASHVLSEVERLCDDVAIVHEGRLRAAGGIGELKDQLGTGLTVTARFVDDAAVERAREVAPDHGGRIIATERTTLEIAADRGDVPHLIEVLEGETDLAGYEVREPGLEAVFEAAIDDGGDTV